MADNLIVSSLSAAATGGRLRLGSRSWPCVLGRSGRRALKREGDGATPLGRMRLLQVLYRADRVKRPQTMLPVRPIDRRDGWCDAPADRNYNRPVRLGDGPLPYDASCEALWRADHAYDLLVVLDYNLRPRRRHKGSAIFLHLMQPDRRPTAGCVALSERDLRQVLRRVGRGAALAVGR